MNKNIGLYLIVTAVKMVINKRNFKTGLIIHTDRWSQYISKKFQKILSKYNAISSMSGPGNPYDNDVIESYLKKLKINLVNNKNYNN